MKHVHAELIKQWADDTTIKVQMEHDGVWYTVEPSIWHPGCRYRIAPRMIRVGRNSWPEPLKEVTGGVMYTFNFITREITELPTLKPSTLAVTAVKVTAVKAGVAHATRDAAEQHRDALICINKGDIE